jgi:hypothetical protein
MKKFKAWAVAPRATVKRWHATDGFQPQAPSRQRESLMGIHSETVDPFQI